MLRQNTTKWKWVLAAVALGLIALKEFVAPYVLKGECSKPRCRWPLIANSRAGRRFGASLAD